MTDEEFQRIKEAEKKRLRSRKRLKEALEALKRRQQIQQVLGRMSQDAESVLRRNEALIDELTAQTALQGARIEIALDEALHDETEPSDVRDEEEIEARAEELVRQLRAEGRVRRTRRSIGRPAEPAEEDATPPQDHAAQDDESTRGRESPPTARPEKTIGRMDP